MRFAILILSVLALAGGQGTQRFTGTITDSECSNADHSHMRMGPTDVECIEACREDHGASYVLYDGKNTFELSDQRTPKTFAGRKVTIVGSLDTKTRTIHVNSIDGAP
jgi:hypothetical protein